MFLLLILTVSVPTMVSAEYVDSDSDGFSIEGGDCDDGNADINPAVLEILGDEVDNDCDGMIDETLWYRDYDLDNYGHPSITIESDTWPQYYTNNNGDCNDEVDTIFPGQVELYDGVDNDCNGLIDEGYMWYQDDDSDGFGNPDVSLFTQTPPAGYVEDNTDFDDTDVTIYPGAPELTDGKDNNGNGLIDEHDYDGDGFYGSSTGGPDCEDNNEFVNPNAIERFDFRDNDCDGLVDETPWYRDSDDDGYGNSLESIEAESKRTGYVFNQYDCDDSDATINLYALEILDNKDNDCDGHIDEGYRWYEDADGDGFGNHLVVQYSLNQPTGYVKDNTDFDDTDHTLYPGAPEIHDGKDNDGNGIIDDVDVDGDGFYKAYFGGTDCDDFNALINPLAQEDEDGVDNNCNGLIDEKIWYADIDFDGFGDPYNTIIAESQPFDYISDNTDCDDLNPFVNIAMEEIVDNIDNNCDGLIDAIVTAEGESVHVEISDGANEPKPIILTFDNVIETGITDVSTSNIGPEEPSGFQFGDPPKFYEFTTSASYSDSIKICINFAGMSFSVPLEQLRLYHFENGEWTDITILPVDISNSIICGSVTSLSPFAILEPSDSEPPIVTNIIATPNPVPVGSNVILTATIDDSTTGSSIITSAEYEIDGNIYSMNAVDGVFDEVTEEVTVTISPFLEPCINIISVRGEDAANNIGQGDEMYLPVYDPSGGFATGGGWIDSAAGAYTPDPTLTGKASFGFVSKYKKGASTPTGETQFQFKVADLSFHSTSYDWLVVAGARAQYKGSGTINGEGDYGFMLTAVDADLNGGGGADKFRIKIWDKTTDAVIYDNMLDSEDDADLTTVLGGGSIKIHKG
jgi:hypothetical protein